MSLSKKIEDKRKAKQRAEKAKQAKIATAGVVLGAVTGAVGGVLLAPKSGKETREDIKDASQQIADKINMKTVDVKGKMSEKLEDRKGNFIESKQKIRNYIDNKKRVEDSSEEDKVIDIVEPVSVTEE
ncbi:MULTISPECIES: YtxH domain-containing protein [unclassified Clostridioides]|uniref:YtxH domain-containing protein n=1 Tax=unclassified Clostridioides TaxID=2635829 RepID=UPI001D0C024D|nr:YtxH domain-containing protein [Clostridioides sp. ES-S-0001-02]MCC0638571.1 YtxH domain-containing protein [Clostridioides sp. ES-S-0049-03]MCC0652586.1 YtxH domain-containing protein [Clostridioides sp. ES-S-0001-03]MCC0655259.1 YtxH domain-containing protein [Clostridioides sp. ES-S-0123-01]MCC0672943.1 YtxH domain-containing protein [Clostridioides sp. ES-S-0145-01]MCC0674959.1 YtxH domain-containing protein [Clostridioides sp. ES-W-0018-02]MCC0697109.1 YtxH domain-containing protein [